MNNSTAQHLRAINTLYEGLKEEGALTIVPSSSVDTMNLSSIAGYAALGAWAAANGAASPVILIGEDLPDGTGRARAI